MATKAIETNESRIPFFGDKMSFITGLDPLGLQNPSSQAYSYLLPGMNNVTSRIRYYSFYCWLFDEYAKKIQSQDPKEQKKFIRKAEYIIALLSIHAGIPGISGSQYATNRFKENLSEFDLETGTYNSDGTTINTYWQYSFGIFGQYYLGSMRQIGLIDEPINDKGEFLGIYRRTFRKDGLKVSGEELAEAFDQIINALNKILFFSCITKGRINTSELSELMVDFNLVKADKNSTECSLLIDLLVDVDEPSLFKKEPSSMRKATLIHILKYAQLNFNKFDDRSFTMYAYESKGIFSQKLDDCLTGWYYYQLNEYWQVACTAIFNGCLQYLEMLKGPGWMSLPELIDSCTKSIVDYGINQNYFKSGITHMATVSKSIPDLEKDLYKAIMKSNKIERMANGFLMIWKLYETNKDNLEILRLFTSERGIGENQDVLSFYLKYDIVLDQTISHYISDFLLHHVIARHQYVAYRKMGGGTQSTQKFILEDNHIRQIGNFDPTYTSPRISNMIAFLHDLNLLNEDNILTVSGHELLVKY
jgi:hypothetical protein